MNPKSPFAEIAKRLIIGKGFHPTCFRCRMPNGPPAKLSDVGLVTDATYCGGLHIAVNAKTPADTFPQFLPGTALLQFAHGGVVQDGLGVDPPPYLRPWLIWKSLPELSA
jgi:hypothetical protein